MASTIYTYSRACLLRRTKTLFSIPRLSTGWRLSSDSASAKKILPIEESDASDDGLIKNQELSSSSSSRGKQSTLSKFVRAIELWDETQDDNNEEIPTNMKSDPLKGDKKADVSFASMLRTSKHFQLGHPAGRTILGRIFEVHGDDLYIDIGGKFHCVCKTPSVKSHEYRRGTQVKLLLQDFEMSAAFLGSAKHVTLLEADATLIGLRRNPSSTSS